AERKLQQAHFFLRKTEDFINQANVEHSLGCISHARGDYTVANTHFQEAAQRYTQIQHRLHLSRLYVHWGNNCYDAEQFTDAEHYFEQSKAMAEEIKNKRQQGLAEIALSLLYGHERFAKRCLKKSYHCLEKGKHLLFQLPNNRRSRLRAHFAWGTY